MSLTERGSTASVLCIVRLCTAAAAAARMGMLQSLDLLFSYHDEKTSLKRHQRVLILGLDGAGKTTLLETLTTGQPAPGTVPTVGFNVQSITYRDVHFTLWDVGGQHIIRPMWNYYFAHTDALCFVVDAADRARLPEAKAELLTLLTAKELEKAVLLVLGNKQDLAGALKQGELVEALGLTAQKGRLWHVQESVASKAVGLSKGMDWIVDALVASRAKRIG
eukprot:g77583.t1